MSRSVVVYEDPCTPPATPPITTNSAPARARSSSSGTGSNASSAAGGIPEAFQRAGGDGLSLDALLRCVAQVLADKCPVIAVVDRSGLEHQLVAKEVEQPGEGRDGRRDLVALDSRDRG